MPHFQSFFFLTPCREKLRRVYLTSAHVIASLRPSVRAYLCVLEELPPEPMFSTRQRFLLPIQSSERTILAVKLCSCAQHPFTCTSSCEPSTWPLRCPRRPASSSRGLCSWTAAPAPATARRGRGKGEGRALGFAGKDSKDPPFRW